MSVDFCYEVVIQTIQATFVLNILRLTEKQKY